jgi:hypothetical protein
MYNVMLVDLVYKRWKAWRGGLKCISEKDEEGLRKDASVVLSHSPHLSFPPSRHSLGISTSTTTIRGKAAGGVDVGGLYVAITEKRLKLIPFSPATVVQTFISRFRSII